MCKQFSVQFFIIIYWSVNKFVCPLWKTKSNDDSSLMLFSFAICVTFSIFVGAKSRLYKPDQLRMCAWFMAAFLRFFIWIIYLFNAINAMKVRLSDSLKKCVVRRFFVRVFFFFLVLVMFVAVVCMSSHVWQIEILLAHQYSFCMHVSACTWMWWWHIAFSAVLSYIFDNSIFMNKTIPSSWNQYKFVWKFTYARTK